MPEKTTDLHVLLPDDVLRYVKQEGDRLGLRPAPAVRAILTACMRSGFSMEATGLNRTPVPVATNAVRSKCRHGNDPIICGLCACDRVAHHPPPRPTGRSFGA